MPAWQALLPIGRASREALRTALQRLDLGQARALLAELRPLHGAPLADALDAMLARHQYRELCALLDRALEQDG